MHFMCTCIYIYTVCNFKFFKFVTSHIHVIHSALNFNKMFRPPVGICFLYN